MVEPIQSREAKHGEKMIEVKVRFWTSEIAEEKGEIVPKHAWTRGTVGMKRNESHGIIPQKSRNNPSSSQQSGKVYQVTLYVCDKGRLKRG